MKRFTVLDENGLILYELNDIKELVQWMKDNMENIQENKLILIDDKE